MEVIKLLAVAEPLGPRRRVGLDDVEAALPDPNEANRIVIAEGVDAARQEFVELELRIDQRVEALRLEIYRPLP